MKRVLALCLGVWLSFLPLPSFAIGEVTEFTLDNGLQVVVVEDPGSPSVRHMLWYRIGAADESPGHSGIAHFVEHLMFKGTDQLESGEFSRVVQALGGRDNAFTSWDFTAYHQTIATEHLGQMMEMEANRMRGLIFDPEEVATERSVILEERAQVIETSPGALFGEQMNAALWLNHPYGRPIIGWRHEMEALTIEAARQWYDRHYHPNNAILIVAGDVTPQEVRALAEEHYGTIPAHPEIEPRETRLRPSEPPMLAEIRLRFEDERVANPYVVIEYRAPERDAGDQEEAAALVLLSQVLSGSEFTSFLAKELVIDNPISLYAGAGYSPMRLDDSSFRLINVPVPGRDLEQAEADIREAIERFLEQGIDEETFERIQFQLAADLIYLQDNQSSLADLYGRALTQGLTIADVQAWPDLLARTTIEDVMQAARDLFAQEAHVIGYLTTPDLAEAEAGQ